MAWVKRNLFMLVGGIIALALLGVAGWYLYDSIQTDNDVAAQLQTATDDLKALVERDPHPGNERVDNIGAAKAEVKRLAALKKDLQAFFAVANLGSTNQARLNPAQFKVLLDNTIDELERTSKKYSVTLPQQYAFSFSSQRKKVEFAKDSLEVLATQLEDIKTIANIVFAARVKQLTSFRRSPVADDPILGGPDYLTRKMVTNKVANTLTSSYEVKFVGFSSDLAAVLEGLVKAPGCFAVKSVGWDRSTTADSDQSSMMAPQMGMRYGGMDPAMAARYGLLNRYAPPAPAAQPGNSAAPPKTGIFLDENKVDFTLHIDTVRLLEAPKK